MRMRLVSGQLNPGCHLSSEMQSPQKTMSIQVSIPDQSSIYRPCADGSAVSLAARPHMRSLCMRRRSISCHSDAFATMLLRLAVHALRGHDYEIFVTLLFESGYRHRINCNDAVQP